MAKRVLNNGANGLIIRNDKTPPLGLLDNQSKLITSLQIVYYIAVGMVKTDVMQSAFSLKRENLILRMNKF
jgi:hypothetical protein